MSRKYRETTGEMGKPLTTPEMRQFCQRPGRTDENGKIIYITQQGHKKECDVNLILKKYDKTGLITHINEFEAEFGDLSGMDFKQAHDLLISTQEKFNELPSDIRKRFQQSPEHLLEFMSDPSNREEAIKLNLIQADWTEATDGLGEHITDPSQRKTKKDPPPPESPPEE